MQRYTKMESSQFEVQWISPGIVRCEQGEFAVLYKEGEQGIYFDGREGTRDFLGYLLLPSEKDWPLTGWLAGRRDVIVTRIVEYFAGPTSLQWITAEVIRDTPSPLKNLTTSELEVANLSKVQWLAQRSAKQRSDRLIFIATCTVMLIFIAFVGYGFAKNF